MKTKLILASLAFAVAANATPNQNAPQHDQHATNGHAIFQHSKSSINQPVSVLIGKHAAEILHTH